MAKYPIAKYPTAEEVRESLSPDELDALVNALPFYDQSRTIATLTLPNFPGEVLNAWAELVDNLRQYGFTGHHSEKTSEGLQVVAEYTYQEMEDKAIAREQGRRYYAAQKAEEAAAKDAEESA